METVDIDGVEGRVTVGNVCMLNMQLLLCCIDWHVGTRHGKVLSLWRCKLVQLESRGKA
jgi:hypothetical protein